VTPVPAYLDDSTDVFASGCSDAHGRAGAQDVALRWASRPEDCRWGNSTSFKHETLILSNVEKYAGARECVSPRLCGSP
jgi:hypothetical protein